MEEILKLVPEAERESFLIGYFYGLNTSKTCKDGFHYGCLAFNHGKTWDEAVSAASDELLLVGIEMGYTMRHLMTARLTNA